MPPACHVLPCRDEGRDALLRRLPARAQVERLHLDSAAFRSQQGPGHAAGGGARGGRHIDDEGVVALVDALCKRRGGDAGARPGARGAGGSKRGVGELVR